MDSDSFVILSCTGSTLICCRKGSSGSTVSFGNFWCYQIFAARCLVGEVGRFIRN